MPSRKSDTSTYAAVIISLAAACAIFCSGLATVTAAGSMRIFFTTPGEVRRPDNPEPALVRLINSSQKYFYGAFYDISSAEITSALADAHKRGVTVRLVTEKDNFDNSEVTRLIRAGIPVVPDTGKGLMHNKFAVVDGVFLWTGSFNATSNCTLKNNNNAILIESPGLAEIYLSEFSEMFDRKIFANRKETAPFAGVGNKYYVKAGDTDINAYFSPDDNIERIIINRLKKAKRSIDFMAFSFTSDAIAAEIIGRHHAGVAVRGIIEKKGSGTKHSEYVKMRTEGIPVKLDRNRYVMHHKVIIIDQELVITGSYNFSRNANTKNDENILIVQSPEAAAQYLAEFRKLYR